MSHDPDLHIENRTFDWWQTEDLSRPGGPQGIGGEKSEGYSSPLRSCNGKFERSQQMGAQNWIVKNGGGSDWGLIKRLVINSGTRQINYADVFVIHTGHIARIHWDNFDVRNEGITLRVSESQVVTNGATAFEPAVGEVVSINVWP